MSIKMRLTITGASPQWAKADPTAVATRDQTWQVCYEKHLDFLSRHADRVLPEYFKGIFRLRLPHMHLPTIAEINSRIAPTRWSAVAVEGFLPGRLFYQLQAKRKVPIASNLRALVHADYSPQPDMLHDLLGHLPFTFADDVMQLTRTIALAAVQAPVSRMERDLYQAQLALSSLKATRDPGEVAIAEAAAQVERFTEHALLQPGVFDHIRRLYQWTVEFGLLRVAGAVKVIGAGLMSSREEFAKFAGGGTPVLPFDERVLDHQIDISGHQKQLFLIEDFAQVYQVLDKAIKG